MALETVPVVNEFMDFVLGLPRTRSGNDTLWVIVDRLTKSAKFIPMNNQWDMDQLARAYLKNVVRYHGVPRSIVSDHDTRYVSKFWEAFQAALDTRYLVVLIRIYQVYEFWVDYVLILLNFIVGNNSICYL